MQDELTELFVFKRGGTPVNIDGRTFYGSASLNEKVTKALSKSSISKPVINHLYKLIDSELVNPLFSTKGFLQFLNRKIFNPMDVDYISGYWSSKHRKVFLLIDSDLNQFGYMSNDLLARIVLHELMHMAAHEKETKFHSLFKQELLLFYKTYWSKVFSLDKKKVNDKDVIKIVTFLRNAIRGRILMSSFFKKYSKLLGGFRDVSFLKKEQFDIMIRNYMVTLMIYYKDSGLFRRNYFTPIWRSVYGPLANTYKEVFSIQPPLMYVQELIIPSEVISALAESRPSAKIYTAVKQL